MAPSTDKEIPKAIILINHGPIPKLAATVPKAANIPSDAVILSVGIIIVIAIEPNT